MIDRTGLPKWTEELSDDELAAEIERQILLHHIEEDRPGIICPNCKTDGNIRLSVALPRPAKWHCRACLHYWEWEP